MIREDAKQFLKDISYRLGNMSIEYLTEKDGERMREIFIHIIEIFLLIVIVVGLIVGISSLL